MRWFSVVPEDDAEAVFLHALAECPGVAQDLLLVGLEIGPQRLAEGDGLGRDDVHERAALHAGENLGVDFLGVLFLAEDDAAARARAGSCAWWWW